MEKIHFSITVCSIIISVLLLLLLLLLLRELLKYLQLKCMTSQSLILIIEKSFKNSYRLANLLSFHDLFVDGFAHMTSITDVPRVLPRLKYTT